MISGDAVKLSVLWVKYFYPFAWDRKEAKFSMSTRYKGLVESLQKQLQVSLDFGWTPEVISTTLRTAYKDNDTGKNLFTMIKKYAKVEGIVLDNLIGTEEVIHHSLYIRGVLKSVYAGVDLMEYSMPLFENTTHTKHSLIAIVKESSLDLVLFAIDLVKDRQVKLKTPWGLKFYFDEVKGIIAQQKSLRKSLLAAAEEMDV